MSSVGPTLPPHLKQKRKRGDEADDVPHSTNSRSRSSSIDSTKKRRVHGPSMPPASLDERPSTSPSPQPNVSKDPPATGDAASNSDSDSDFGPAPAPAGSGGGGRPSLDATTMDATSNEPQKPQREEWMLAPPSHSDWTSRLDPTKLRNRKFNTGKGAKGPSQSGSTDNRLWTETPEQKRQRLADEVMGTKKPAQMEEGPKKPPRNEAEDRETERKIREYNEANRGKSLYRKHKTEAPKDQEDDPSARAFDREKDIGGAGINFTKRRELINKASDFGSRFAKGSYL